MFLVAVFTVAVLSGGTAAVTGFGIGSLLTPLFAGQFDITTSVAAVAIPHLAATAVRCWRMRRSIDREVLRGFGMLSAAGGLMGALFYARLPPVLLTIALGLLLLATSAAAVLDLHSRVRITGRAVGALGFLSGLFGGLAGNQGGLRAAAMLSLPLPPVRYVATATATALLVDLARTPVYLWRAGPDLYAIGLPLTVATAGVLAGTRLGEAVLMGLSPRQFRFTIGAIIGILGLWLIVQAV
jgi:uncharacterized membrane protein YfcA